MHDPRPPAAAATRLQNVFDGLLAASAPDTVVADLVVDALAQITAHLLSVHSPSAVCTVLDRVYERLRQNITLYHGDYRSVIDCSPTAAVRRSRGVDWPLSVPAEIQVALGRLAMGKRFSAGTALAYRRRILIYIRWLDEAGINYAKATSDDVERFLSAQGLCETSKRDYLTAIHRFYDVLQRIGAMANPAYEAARARSIRKEQRKIDGT